MMMNDEIAREIYKLADEVDIDADARSKAGFGVSALRMRDRAKTMRRVARMIEAERAHG